MLVRIIKPWQNFVPPCEVVLADPVATILIQRRIAEVPAPAPKKTKPGKNAPDARKDK